MIKKKMSLRTKIYMFVLVAGIINILMPCVVHADVFGVEIQDVYVDITDNVRETNELLEKAYTVSMISPYDIFKKLSSSSSMASNIHTASQTVALVVATLLLMVDFFRKSVTFEWSSRWENILLFLIKIIAVKQVVQNTDVIVSSVYALFNYINDQAIGGSADTVEFLPYGKTIDYEFYSIKEFLESAATPWWNFLKIGNTETIAGHHHYIIAEDAVKMFYPDAVLPNAVSNEVKWGTINFPNPTGKVVFGATIEKIFMYPYFLFMKIISYFIFVVVIGRTFELCVYTLLAPLPLATFASEVTHDTAKNFLRNYIAVILQMTTIAAMFAVYVVMTEYFVTNAGGILKGTKMVELLILTSLALGVQKSGEWSRRLCGAA